MSEYLDRDGGLAEDTMITGESGTQYRIVRTISTIGHRFVYQVDAPDGPKYFIQYRTDTMDFQPELMNRIRRMIRAGSPDERFFVWPQDTIASDEIQGYIIDLVRKPFVPLFRYTMALSRGDNQFLDARVMADVMLHLVSAFHALHMRGCCFQDVNPGNCLINPQTGDLRFIDCVDSISIAGQDDTVFGTPGFMAPEVVNHKTAPNRCSDYFSLSVLLFGIFFRAHPLEGSRGLQQLLTPDMYRDDPVFIFDPADARNRPDANLQQYVIRAWEQAPSYLRGAFTMSLDREALLTSPRKRLGEASWERVLIRLRNDIMICPACDRETIYTGWVPEVCPYCNKPFGQLYAFRTERWKYPIPISFGSALLSANLRYCDTGEGGSVEIRVYRAKSDHRKLVIRNVSGGPVVLHFTDGRCERLAENGLAALSDIRQLIMQDGTAASVEPLA